jgi:hypothetical protein
MVDMPPPNQEDVEWAYYLWNSLAVGEGKWTLPNVGAYIRTGNKELTLTEIHFSKPPKNNFGLSVFDNHHWIMVLADNIGWEIKERVVIATDTEGVVNIPDELIGSVSMCAERCGAVFRVEELSPSKQYVKIEDDLRCPCCSRELAVEPILKSVHIVLDDRGYTIKQQKLAIEKEEE